MQKIFVIEDDENIRNLVKIAMEGYGYQVAALKRRRKRWKNWKRKNRIWRYLI